MVAAAAAAIAVVLRRARKAEGERDRLTARIRGVADADAEEARVRAAITAEQETARAQLRDVQAKAEARLKAETQSALGEQARLRAAIAQEQEAAHAELRAIHSRAAAELQAAYESAVSEQARIRAAIAHEQGAAASRLQEMAFMAEERARKAERAVDNVTHEISALEAQRQRLHAEVQLLDEKAHLYSFGLYNPHFDCATSEEFSERLERVREEQKAQIRAKTAVIAGSQWTVNGSVAEGRKQINQTIKLMLRAFNGECDAAVAKVRYNNIHVMEARITKAWEMVNSLAEVQQCRISNAYYRLKMAELHLEFEYEEKRQAEKEEQRRIRQQMREEEIALKEIEKARLEAEKEEDRAAVALVKARREAAVAEGAKQIALNARIAELEGRLAEAHERKERAISRAQMTRSGHVYVISNIGSFGEHVYKIGMTRRLDPVDRIKELGDASVPFDFDIHAVIYADDAPGLEAELHRTFTPHRINRVNERKEFFRVSIDAIAEVVRAHRGEIELTMIAEAPHYRKTLTILEEERRRSLPVADGGQPYLGVERRES